MKRTYTRETYLACIIISLLINASTSITAQTEEKQNLAQYLFPAFNKSTIITKAGKIVNLILNYNTVSEKMVFEQKEQYYDLINPETVDTAIIENRKFIPHEKVFLEVAVNDQISFYIQHKSDLEPPGRPAGYGQTSQLTSSNYLSGMNTPSGYYNFKLPDGYTIKPTPVYWIKVNDEMHSFFGEKQFLKIFPGKSDTLKQYIKQNRIKFDRKDDIERLVRYCNEQPSTRIR